MTDKEALADLFEMIDTGLLVRDISHDHEPMWVLRQMEFVQRLAKCKAVLDA